MSGANEHRADPRAGQEARPEVGFDVARDPLHDASRFRAHFRALVVILAPTQLREDLPKDPLVPQALRLRSGIMKCSVGFARSADGGQRAALEEQCLGSERSDSVGR